MSNSEFAYLLRHLQQRSVSNDVTDEELMERFVASRDELAFEFLVRRHGPMVLGVCRRILDHTQDSEDAFQATFMVLARRANSVTPGSNVGNWLYGVANRTAMELRRIVRRRQTRESQVASLPDPAVTEEPGLDEFERIFEEELTRLPEHYRAAIVLCDLEGQSQRVAAQQLGWPPGTLSGRLFRARKLLADQLERRGFRPGSGSFVPFLSATGFETIPSPLIRATVSVSVVSVSGTIVESACRNETELSEGVSQTMFSSQWKMIAASTLVFGLLTIITASSLESAQRASPPGEQLTPSNPAEPRAAQRRAHEPDREEPTSLPEQFQSLVWQVDKVDLQNRSIDLSHRRHTADSLMFGDNEEWQWKALVPQGRLFLRKLVVSKKATVRIDGKPAKYRDLQKSMRVRTKLSDRFVVTHIEATSPSGRTMFFHEANPERRTITVTLRGKKLTLPMSKSAVLVIFGRRNPKLTDLEAGVAIDLELTFEEGRPVVSKVKSMKKGPPRKPKKDE